jgi:site-specific DNA recombinase
MNFKNTRAAAYARVSSDGQVEGNTIASQLEALAQRISGDGLELDPELRFVDDGYSGSTLVRPALERLRDQAAAGGFDRLYVHSPDRIARSYVYQMLLVDELRRCGVELVFLNHEIGKTPEDHLLLQMQGMMAEYERAKILERVRRGKLHSARAGRVSAVGKAPYGYRYVSKAEGGGTARWEVHPEEAAVVELMFRWMGLEGCSLAEISRRLKQRGVRTQLGRETWLSRTIWGMLKNEAYKGATRFGKTCSAERRTRLRPHRGRPEHPRRARSVLNTPVEDQVPIPVPALVSEDLFDAVQERLLENKKRNRRPPQGVRYLLQGLAVCKRCGYAYCGQSMTHARKGRGKRSYQYYFCTGSMFGRCDRERVCWNKSVRMELLDAAVWEDVRGLLAEPSRVEAEYQRRLEGRGPESGPRGESLDKMIRAAKRRITRLIDAYEDGLMEKAEFEPRIVRARDRLSQLETESRAEEDRQAAEQELRLVIGQLEGFAQRVREGLGEAEWGTRREVIRALVKRVEIDESEVRVVYKVRPCPFAEGPERGRFQDRVRRSGARSWRPGRRATDCEMLGDAAGVRRSNLRKPPSTPSGSRSSLRDPGAPFFDRPALRFLTGRHRGREHAGLLCLAAQARSV